MTHPYAGDLNTHVKVAPHRPDRESAPDHADGLR